MKKFVLLLFIFSFLLPVLLGAADLDLDGLITNTIRTLYDPIVTIIFSLAFIAFFWGMLMMIASAGDTVKREEGRKRMLWGIVVLFVMFSIWGIIGILKNSFDLNETPIDTYPDFYPVNSDS